MTPLPLSTANRTDIQIHPINNTPFNQKIIDLIENTESLINIQITRCRALIEDYQKLNKIIRRWAADWDKQGDERLDARMNGIAQKLWELNALVHQKETLTNHIERNIRELNSSKKSVVLFPEPMTSLTQSYSKLEKMLNKVEAQDYSKLEKTFNVNEPLEVTSDDELEDIVLVEHADAQITEV